MRSVKEARRQMLMNVKAVLNIPGTRRSMAIAS